MKILTISDSPLIYSGLARVHRNVIDGFVADGHNVLPCVWWGYDETTLKLAESGKRPLPDLNYDSNGMEIRMLHLPKRASQEVKRLYDIMNMARPDLVVTIGDYWDTYYMQALKIKMDYSFKWLTYVTVERDEIDKNLVPLFEYADAIAVPTEYGKSVLEPIIGKPVSVVPYGIDPCFEPYDEERKARLREERDCTDKTRFICVGQNTLRKNIPALVQAVKIIAHRDPHREMQFYVHTNVDADNKQEASIYDLRSIVSKLGVENWFSFPEDGNSIFSGLSDTALVDEYNASDFFVLPSTCEGFGLPLCEAMACGLPVVANGASCMPDHLGECVGGGSHGLTRRGFLAGNRLEICPPDLLTRPIRPDALGQAIWEMARMTKDEEGRRKIRDMREVCVKYAKGLRWDEMKRKLCDIAKTTAGPISLPVEVID